MMIKDNICGICQHFSLHYALAVGIGGDEIFHPVNCGHCRLRRSVRRETTAACGDFLPLPVEEWRAWLRGDGAGR